MKSCARAFAVFLVAGTLSVATVHAATAEEQLAAIDTLYRTQGPTEALPRFEALAKKLRGRDARGYAMAIGFIGECQWRLGNFDEADGYLRQALALKQQLGDRAQEARTINVMGLLAWHRGRYPEAIAHFERTAEISRELGDRKLEGAALNNLSLVGDELGDYTTSLERYQRVLLLFREIGFTRGEGDVLGNIGGVNLLLGRFGEAERYYAQALAISVQLDSKTSLSQDHGNLAMSLLGEGKVRDALAHFDEAAKYATDAGIRRDQAYWQRGKANALEQQGRYDDALGLYRAAAETYKDIGADPERVEALHDLGNLYLLLGDAPSAQLCFDEALALAQEIGLARGVTSSLLALGDLASRRERPAEATALYSQALSRAKEAGETVAWQDSLLRLALTQRDTTANKDALAQARQALDLARQNGARRYESEALYALGELERETDPAAALLDYDAALVIANQTNDPELQWQIHYGIGRTHGQQGRLDEAIAEMSAAVAVIESVRERLSERRFRAGYVQDKYQVFVDLARLQLKRGHMADAFSTAERLRSQSYVAMVESRAAKSAADAASARETELKERIRQLQFSLQNEQAKGVPERRDRAIDAFTEDLSAAERDYETLLDDRRRTSGRFAALAQPTTYDAVRAQLRAGEAVIEYLVDRDAVIAFVITSRALDAHVQLIAETDLNAKIELLRDLIRRPDSSAWRKPANSLSKALFEPLRAGGALNGVTKLQVVPHGVLNYLPFDVLPSGDGVLIDTFALAYLPSAAALALAPSAAASTETMLVMAPARSRLRYAADEASSVDAVFRPNSRLLLGTAATEAAFYSYAERYRNLHLVTHGHFNKQNPLLSGLELEADADHDGLLEVHEIMGLTLDADLVTLSACQTGLGSGFFADVPAGDDFVGLTRAFLYAGSANVIATLWEVDDRSSGLLMERFYRHFGAAGAQRDKAAALAWAQREIRATPGYAHPYYWAAFVLVGNTSARNSSVVQPEIKS